MATLDEVIKANEERNYGVSEGALVAFYEFDPNYWADTEAEDVCRACEDNYQGEYSDGAEFAEQFIDNLEYIPEVLRHHVNWADVWSDLEMDGYYIADGFVFTSNY